MILKLTDTTGEKIFYSSDVLYKIREINHELYEVYPECAQYCIKIDEVIDEG